MTGQDYLSDQGKYIFKKIAEHLQRVGVTDRINTYELSMLANSLDLYATAATLVKHKGFDQDNKRSGGKVITPAYAIMKNEYQNIQKHAPKFGINHVDMAKLAESIPEKKDDSDPLTDLMTVSST